MATARKARVKKVLTKPSKKSREAQAKELAGEKLVKHFIEEDPSNSNKYLLWMAQQSAQGQRKEDITATVKSFHRRSKSLTHQDIYKYNDLKELENEILKLNPSKSERRELKNLSEGQDYIELFKKDPLELYYVNSYKGCRNLGKGTNWCIAANSGYWKSYNNYNNVFVLINNDQNNTYKKTAILINKHDGSVPSHGYNAVDCTYNWETKSSQDVIEDVNTSAKLIHAILEPNKRAPISSTSKSGIIFSYNEKNKSKTKKKTFQYAKAEFLAKEVIDRDWIKIMPFSKNKELLLALKDTIIERLGNNKKIITTPEGTSHVFIEVFQDNIDGRDLLSTIKTGQVNKGEVTALKKIIQSLSKEEFAELVNNCSRATTRKYILEMQPKYWEVVKPEKVTAGLANYLVKTHGVKAIPKGYKNYGKKSYKYPYWGGSRKESLNPYTKWVNKQKAIPKEVLTELKSFKDLPKQFKTFIKKKEGKMLPKQSMKALREVAAEIAKTEGVSLDKLTGKQLKEYIESINES